VKAWELLGQADAPDGSLLTLSRLDREYAIFANGKMLMSSRMHGSEEALAEFAFRRVSMPEPRVLVGGLGLGFTLRAVLDRLPPHAAVTVAEIVPAVVEWNRGPLGPLANHPLRDGRVSIHVGDVLVAMQADPGRFDAVLLDVDNGPRAFTTSGNAALYSDRGMTTARAALKPGGILAVWSAWDDRKFEQRVRYNGFTVEVHRVRARLKQGGPRHVIFLLRPDLSRRGAG
jgi:spermidine synthase